MKSIKILSLPALCLLLGTTQAHALDVKQEMIKACTKETVELKIANQADANKFCSCSMEVRSKMTLEQIWEVQSLLASGKDPSNLAHVKKSQAELDKCTQGITLNPPQLPEPKKPDTDKNKAKK